MVQVVTEIAAAPSAVYAALMDFESYGQWNPMVVYIQGEPTVGEQLVVDIKIGEKAPQRFTPTVLVNDSEKEFRWVGQLLTPWFFRGEHYFMIQETGEGNSIFTHGEIFSGIMAPILAMVLGSSVDASFKAFNDALKERVEGDNQ